MSGGTARPGPGQQDLLDPLLERASVLDAASALLDTVAERRFGCLVVEGPAGIGKTSVLDRAATTAADRGIVVRRATGDDLEAQLPWGMVRRLFPDVSADDLVGSAALARPVFAPGGLPEGTDQRADLFPLLHGLHALVCDLAEDRPALLVLDDVQWSDPQTVRLVTYLLNRADSLPVGILVGLRTGGCSSPEVAELLPRVAASPATVVYRLSELSADAVTTLVRSGHPAAGPGFCAELRRATGGNPFLVQEMLSAIRSEGVPLDEAGAAHLVAVEHAGIRTSILVRLAQLGPDAPVVAAAAAVLGPAGTADRLARLTGLDAARASRVVDSLVAAEILRAVSDRVDFVHPIIRETVHADIGPARRAGLHAAAALVLRDDRADAADVAAHLMAAGGTTEAWGVPYLRRAAATALGQGAPDRARELLEAALTADAGEAAPRILVELGRAEAAAGRASAANRFGEALDALGVSAGDATVACEIGEALYSAGRYADAFDAFERGLAVLPRTDGEGVIEARLVAGVVLSGTLAVVGPQRVASVLSGRDLAGAGSGSLARRALAASEAGRHAFGLGVPPDDHRHEVVVRLADAALDGDPLPLEVGVVILELVTLALYVTRQLDRATQELDRLIGEAERAGVLPPFASLLAIRGLTAVQAGRLDRAAEDGRLLLHIAAEFPSMNVQMEPAARRVLTDVALLTGDRDAALEAIAVPDAEERWGGSILYAWYLDAVGQVELDRGNAEAARSAFLESGARFVAPGGSGGHTAWRTGAAEAADALGSREEALSLADEEVRVARAFGTPTRLAEAVRARARFLPAELAVEELTEAAAWLDPAARLSGARFELELGSALRRAGRRREAREHLRSALALARECGATSLAGRAVAELAAAGARRPTGAVVGVDALTPSERRVAELAARGLTNREIATDLFVTRKTVEVHLSACYRKLGISARAELAGALENA